MSQRFFGTDGIRGKVGEGPINAEFIMKLGWAVGKVLAPNGKGKVLIGKDTRVSGYLFESALQAGLSSAGVDIQLLGPMPTPAIAYLTRTLHAQAGIVISASHNPYDDNGIKFFSDKGTKLPDAVELEIEAQISKPMTTVESAKLGRAMRIVDAAGRYIEFCKSTIPMTMDFRGLKIVLDCAHGATYHVAPSVFTELGAEVIAIGVDPNGVNINKDCGSTAPDALCKKVKKHQADLGIAFDGDGDRLLMIDHEGNSVDGDELLYIIAQSRRREGTLHGGVVGTVMSNLGLEQALSRAGIFLKRSKVGDRYVLEMLKQDGWLLGGESSGHIICLDRTSTGDGIVSALQVLAEMVITQRSLKELRSGIVKYPQCMVNVRLSSKTDVLSIKRVTDAVKEAESQLAGNGRVLLRPSGTEPLVRVMVEGQDKKVVENIAHNLASVVEQSINARPNVA